MRPLVVKPRKRGPHGGQRLEWVHKQHRRHHDGEDLQRVAGHVHHDCVHWDGFGGGESEFPRFLEEEVVCFGGCWGWVRFAAGFLGGVLVW